MADVEAEIAELEASMAEDIDGYFKDEAAQARYAALIEARETGSAAPVSDRNAARRAELEDMMRQSANTSPYWSGPNAAELQAEYGELLAAPQSPPDAAGEADRDSGERTLGDILRLDAEGVAEVTERVERAFEDVDCTDLDIAFDSLSPRAQLGFYAVLAHPEFLRSEAGLDTFVDWIGDEPFGEMVDFEKRMLPQERAALRQALLLT